ncbi:uncharacterized protein M6B38_334610 [Iris pallida]|nr:uncharacterized protein M6B38_334610 [Iris pallida]
MGIDGWRVAFHIVAIISVIVGVLVWLYAVDPHYSNTVGTSNEHVSQKSIMTEVKELFKEAKTVMKIPSFQIIVAQGVTGSFPWSALSFAPMWLELIGFSHKGTGLLMGMFVVANALGGLFGGKMGDFLSERFPNSGRIVLSQISSGSAIPLAAVLMLALPDDPSTVFSHGLVLFIMGLSISWNSAATNNPIFAEIVPERSRTSIYALDRSIESILSSFAPPVVGILAEHVYGYKPVPGSSEVASIETDRENAAPLAKALYTAIAIPMTLCCFIYSFLYCTYPRDRERARMDSLIESEMQNIEFDSPRNTGESSQGRTVIDIAYEEEDFETEDDDENKLLSHQMASS